MKLAGLIFPNSHGKTSKASSKPVLRTECVCGAVAQILGCTVVVLLLPPGLLHYWWFDKLMKFIAKLQEYGAIEYCKKNYAITIK